MLAGTDPWAEAAATAGQVCVAVASSCLLVPLSSGYTPETWLALALAALCLQAVPVLTHYLSFHGLFFIAFILVAA